MSGKNSLAVIQIALIEHSVIIVDGIHNTRIFCKCGWRMTELDRTDAETSRALHQADAVKNSLYRWSVDRENVVDAELVEDEVIIGTIHHCSWENAPHCERCKDL